MSLYGALFTGVAGLNANSRALSVTSTNIANVNTVGYKGSKTEFETLIVSGSGSENFSTGGVKGEAFRQVSKQGDLQTTGVSTDLAVSGSGFFPVTELPLADPAVSDLLFTRAGSFAKDASGRLVNSAGYFLQGWELDANGNVPTNSADLTVINLSNVTGTAEATSTAKVRANLRSTQTAVGAYTAGQLNSGAVAPHFETSFEVYDGQGGAQPIRLSTVKTGANTWAYEMIYDGPAANIGGAGNNPIGTGVITFNTDGTIATPAAPVNITIPYAASSGLSPQTIAVNLGAPGQADGVTQFDTASTLYSTNVNGALFGGLSGVRVDSDGFVIALFDNGVEKKIYKVPVATFTNPDGLVPLSGNAYRRSVESGDVALKEAKNGGAGSVAAAALEQSTVDLGKEFSDMIVIQRAYSAASKIIMTADEMLEELTRLKR
jgi:flagellar hook protein FlgE